MKRLMHTHFALGLHNIKRAAAVLVDLHRLGSRNIHLELLGKVPCSTVPPQRHVHDLHNHFRNETHEELCGR